MKYGFSKKWMVTSRAILLLLALAVGNAWAISEPEKLLQSDPQLSSLTVREQTLNDRVEDLSEFSSIVNDNQLNPLYLPEKQPVFPLKVLHLRPEDVDVYTVKGLPEEYLVRDPVTKEILFIRLFIHPESETLYADLMAKEDAEKFLATPHSSHRSLVVKSAAVDALPFLMKVSLNVRIGAVIRTLEREHIKRSVGISAIFNSMNSEALAARGILFFDESSGVVPKKVNAGYSSRSWPKHVPQDAELIPMMSLYAKPNGEESILERMIRESGRSAKDFLRQNIIDPLLEHSIYLATREGLMGEPHEQNVLLEAINGRPTRRFAYRDFGGYSVFQELRTALGKGYEMLPQGITAEDIKPHNGDIVSTLVTYIRKANLFALHAAVKDSHPEITAEWIDAQFADSLSESFFRNTKQVFPIADGENQDIKARIFAAFKKLNSRKITHCRDTFFQIRSTEANL